MHRINVRGTFVVGQQAARRLRRSGAIINFSSSVVKIVLPSYTAYAATKGAVDAMTLILARELRGRDITVNAVAPGPTATPLFLDEKDQATIGHRDTSGANLRPNRQLLCGWDTVEQGLADHGATPPDASSVMSPVSLDGQRAARTRTPAPTPANSRGSTRLPRFARQSLGTSTSTAFGVRRESPRVKHTKPG